MSIYDKASLIQIPSGYRAGKLYSVIPNSGAGDFTVTGDAEGDATRVNSQGLIETVNANVPRLDYPFIDGVVQDCPHLLLESQRTNDTTYSKDFTQTSYWNNVIDVVVTKDEAVAPNGTYTANKIQANSGSNFKILRKGSFTIPSGITMSIFVKRGNHDYIMFKAQGDYNFNLNTLTWGGSYSNVGYELYPNDWIRLYATTTSSVLSYFGIYLTDSSFNQYWNATGNEFVYVWGAQYETGTYASSYISTNGNSVTRLKDECTNGGNADLFNDSEGTLFVDLENFDTTATELTLSSGSTTNRITFLFYGSTFALPNKIRFLCNSNGGSQVDSLYNISYTFNQRNKIAFRYKQNDFKAYINGTQVFSDTSGNTPIGLSRFDFTKFDATSGFIEGEINQAMVFNEALSDSELQTLTTL